MSQPSPVRTAQWQVRCLAELAQFDAQCREPGRLLARAQGMLAQIYAAEQVQLGPQRRYTCAFPADVCDAVPAGAVRLLRRDAETYRAVPFDGKSATGHGLLLRLTTGDVAGWAASAARVLDAADGEFLHGIACLLLSAFERRQKAGDRRQQVRRVIRAKHEWQAVVDALPQGLVLLGRDARVLRVNRTMETWGLIPVKRACGRQLGAALGRLQPVLAPAISQALAELAPAHQCTFDAQHPALSKRLLLTLRRLAGPCVSGGAHALLVFDDVSGRHEAEEAMDEYSQRLEFIMQACAATFTKAQPQDRRANVTGDEPRSAGELQRLAQALVQAEERERKRVAMELHDGIGQSLSAIRIGLEAQRAGAPRQCRECVALTDVDTRVRDTIDEVRRISLALRPPMLDDLGLLPTLEWFLREIGRAPKGPCLLRRFDAREEHIPRPLRAVIFRILQEAMRNVVEHAGASHVEVLLAADAHTVTVSVRDNGRGFEPAALRQAERPGFGLMAMRERAEMSAGAFVLQSLPGEGTLIRVHWRTG